MSAHQPNPHDSRPARAEELLAHAGWLRNLARSLVRDGSGADDLVQDAWILALRHPPRADRPLAPWLDRVLRNAARSRHRSDDRRTQREVRTFEDRHEPGADETAAAIEMQRVLLDAVEQLSPQLRSTVVRHYFHGSTSVEIAREDGVADSTVRARLRQAIEELRSKLDDRHDGSRGAWIALLQPLVRPNDVAASATTTVGIATIGGIAVGTLGKFGAVAAAVALLSFGTYRWIHEEPSVLPTAASESTARTQPNPSGEATVLASVPDAQERTSVAALEAPHSTPTAVAALDAPATIEARLLDARGAPIRNGVMWCTDRVQLDGLARDLAPSATTDSDGRARLALRISDASKRRGRAKDWPADTWTAYVAVGGPSHATRGLELQVRAGGTFTFGDVTLLDAGDVVGRVIDGADVALAGVEVLLGLPDLTVQEREGAPWSGLAGKSSTARATTSSDGAFAFPGIAVGTYRIWTRRPGYLTAFTEPFEITLGGKLELPPISMPENTSAILGRLVRADGTPARGEIRVCATGRPPSDDMERIWSDSGGSFVVPTRPGQLVDLLSVTYPRQGGARSAASMQAVKAGTRDVLLRLEPLPMIELLVQDESGRSIESFGFDLCETSSMDSEGTMNLRGGRTTFSALGAQFRVRVKAQGYQTKEFGPYEPQHAPQQIVAVLTRGASIHGHVTADGRPVDDAEISLHALIDDDRRTGNGFPLRMSAENRLSARTTPDGSFAIDPQAPPVRIAVVRAVGYATWESQPLDISTADGLTLDVVLTRGGSLRGTVPGYSNALPGARFVSASRGDGRDVSAWIADDGSFAMEHMTPGTWWVRVTDRDYTANIHVTSSPAAPDNVPVVVVEGETTRVDLKAKAESPATFEGTVRVDGHENGEWTVHVGENDALGGSTLASESTGSDGSFRLKLDSANRCWLILRSPSTETRSDSLRCEVQLTPGPNRRDIAIATGALKAGTTRNDLVSLAWTSTDGVEWTCQWKPNRTEALLLTGVPAGHVVLKVGERLVAEVDVRVGETSNVEWR